MIILNVKNLSFSIGTTRIIDDATFFADSADHCGVIGVNGAGKSTLFALLNRDYEPDGGVIQYARGTTVAYFRQNDETIVENTIGEAVRGVFSDVIAMEAELERLAEKIDAVGTAATDATSLAVVDSANMATIDAASLAKNSAASPAGVDAVNPAGVGAANAADAHKPLINRYDRLHYEFELAGGYEYRSRIRGVLNGLDIGEGIDDATPVSILSGGQKTRLALALLLLRPPDLLLLDEPTNHLDIRSLEWLESYLKNYKKCFLVVSHDRYFLDAVTTRTLEMEYRRLTAYAGGYTAYLRKKAEDREVQQRQYENQQREISRLEAIVEQYRRWNTERSHIMAKSREKAIERIEKIDRPANAPKKVTVRFDNAVSNSQDALYIDEITKSYSGRRLFEPFTTIVRRGDRITVLGPNGCGKSTFLRILAGRLEPDCGQIEAGQKIEINYYDQENHNLDEEKTIIDEVYGENIGKHIAHVRGALGAFLFTGDDVYKQISVLSGGEKARVALAKLVLSRANMLLLDEPTNYLDINTREKLEDALLDFKGVIIAVSHDRYFIKKLATRIFYFEDGRINDFAGGYGDLTEYLASHGKAAPGSAPAASSAVSSAVPPAASPAMISGSGGKASPGATPANSASGGGAVSPDGGAESGAKNDWLAARRERALQKKRENRLTRLEGQIDGVEKRLSELDLMMISHSVVSDHVKLIEYMEEQKVLKSELDGLLAEWESLSETIET